MKIKRQCQFGRKVILQVLGDFELKVENADLNMYFGMVGYNILRNIF